MSHEQVADFLVMMMPWSVGAKTIGFGILFLILLNEDSGTKLGRWITAFFAMTFLTSVGMTLFVGYIASVAEGSDVQTPIQWAIVTLTNVFPFVTTLIGVRVAYLTIVSEREEAAQRV